MIFTQAEYKTRLDQLQKDAIELDQKRAEVTRLAIESQANSK